MQATKLDVVVPNNHKITLTIPTNIPSGPAEVVIMTKEQTKSKEQTSEERRVALLTFMEELRSRPPSNRNPEEIEAYIEETRNSWDDE